MIRTSITRPLMAFFALFSNHNNNYQLSKVFETLKKVLQTLSLKRSCYKTFSIPKFVIDTIT